jgi:hypothetical protein
MPLYEIECKSCQKTKEIVLGLSEVDQYPMGSFCEYPTTCACGCNKFKRLVGAHSQMKVNWSEWSRKK